MQGACQDLGSFAKLWNVVVPLEGLQLNEKIRLKVGPVEILTMDQTILKEQTSLIMKILQNNPHYSNEKKTKIARSLSEKYNEHLSDEIEARIKTRGTAPLALGRSLITVRKALNILVLLLLPPMHSLRKPSVMGECLRSRIRPFIVASSDYFKSHWERVGGRKDLEITSTTLGKLDQSRTFSLFCAILEKENQCETEILQGQIQRELERF